MSQSTVLGRQNFSKIGKYISNKLHRLQMSKPQERHCLGLAEQMNVMVVSELKKESNSQKRSVEMERRVRELPPSSEAYEPSVGSYNVNFTCIQKNHRVTDFGKSTPHFFNPKPTVAAPAYAAQEYPACISAQIKGFKDMARMPSRDQIKGNRRKNAEDPHEKRFFLREERRSCSSLVDFVKMAPRKESVLHLNESLAMGLVQYEIGMPRLDTHIIDFGKQAKRSPLNLKPLCAATDSFASEYVATTKDKSVLWKNVLPREDNKCLLPSYMNGTNHSRMMVETINQKCLAMNCFQIKENKVKKNNKENYKQVLYKQEYENQIQK